MPLDAVSVQYLIDHSRGRLSTIGPDGSPQVKPVGYRLSADDTIDIGGLNMESSAKYRNIAANPNVAFVVDDSIGQGASGQRFLEIRGQAEQVVAASSPEDGLSPHRIHIHPRRLVSFNLDPAHPGMQTRELTAETDPAGTAAERPTLDPGGPVTAGAVAAVRALVEEFQVGWDRHDADISNRRLAADIVWGSPFGATVHSYEDLHAIHVRLKQAARGGAASRFEIVKVIAPAPGVAVAQVRRVAFDRGEPVEPTDDLSAAFSEMALYVLVRRDGSWWLAAGQNTPIRSSPQG